MPCGAQIDTRKRVGSGPRERPAFAPLEKIALIEESSMPAVLIEMDMIRAPEAPALRIEGHTRW